MDITSKSGKVLSNKNSAGTKNEKVQEQSGTNDDKSAPVDDLEEIITEQLFWRKRKIDPGKIAFTTYS